MDPVTRWSLISAMLIAGLAVMHYYAPLQPCSVIFDLALLAILAGSVSLINPLHFLSIGNRKQGLAVLAAGVIVGWAALNWPAPLVRADHDQTKLDEFMPAYHVSEFHSVRVHAPPDRVWDATKLVTFSDVRIFATLMQIRMMAVGHFSRVRSSDAPILQSMAGPRSNFLTLAEEDGHELVMGLAGKFWNDHGPAKVVTSQEFLGFQVPGCAKAAFNFRVEDLGNGWTRVSTETRGLGVDDEGRRIFARYWRVIYPGSGAIRRMWLNAIRTRAERG
jgi:hypothetical protein